MATQKPFIAWRTEGMDLKSYNLAFVICEVQDTMKMVMRMKPNDHDCRLKVAFMKLDNFGRKILF